MSKPQRRDAVGATTTTRIADYGANDNRITGMTENGTALRSYSYDGAGNIVTDVRGSEILAYTYNNRNRLSSVTRNAVAHAAYQYNAFEQLVSRNAVGGTAGTVHYIYDLDGHLIAETNAATGATTREYLWLPANDNSNDTPAETEGIRAANDNMAGGVVDLPLAVINVSATPTMFHVHSDHLGRPIRMTDAAKATVWQATWKPWGEPQSITGPQANNLRFPGQYFQLETGLAYNWHRHYDPVTGRYIQPDPLRFVDGPSVYAYAGNSPFMTTDREGLKMYPDTYTGPLPPDGWYESEGTKTICGIIPPYPPGQGPIQNMNEASKRYNPFWFKNQVGNKGPWDYKQKGRKYTDYGNFNFGASGKAYGLPRSVLKRGAGWANSKADPSRTNLGNWYDWNGSYGDDPADQGFIDQGINFCSCARP